MLKNYRQNNVLVKKDINRNIQTGSKIRTVSSQIICAKENSKLSNDDITF